MSESGDQTPSPLAVWLHEHAGRCPRLPWTERASAGVFVEWWRFRCPLCGDTSPTFPLPCTPRRGGARDD